MSRISLTDLHEHIEDYLPDRTEGQVARAGNLALIRMMRHLSKPERATFTTEPKYTTGTVTVTQDDATVTGSGTTFASAMADQIISIDGDDAWFQIKTFSSTTALELGSEWAAAGGGSKTYTIAYPLITLPQDCFEVLRISRDGQRYLQFQNTTLNFRTNFQYETGEPEFWGYAPPADNGRKRLRLWKAPDVRYVYEYYYHTQPNLFDEDAPQSLCDWDQSYRDVLLHGTLKELLEAQGETDRYMVYEQRFMGALSDVGGQDDAGHAFRMRPARSRRGLMYRHGGTIA